MPIQIRFLAQVSNFLRGTSDVEQALEDVADSLDDVAKDSERSSEKMADGYEDAAKDVDKSTERIERSFKELATAAKKSGDKAGDGLAKGVKEGTKKSEAALDEAKSEAGQSGREAAASFSGGFDDVADFLQETLANAFGGFGPIGAAAGAALAIVIGSALAQASAAQEKLQEAREKAIGLAQTMAEDGGEIPLTTRVNDLIELLGSERLARNPIESLANDFIDLGTNLDLVTDAARAAKVPVANLFRALTGDDLSLTKRQLDLVNDALEDLNQESGSVNLEGWQQRKDALTGLKKELETVVTQQELAGELADSVEFINAQKVEEAKARMADLSESVSQSATEMFDSIRSDAVDAATSQEGVFDVSKWITLVEESRVQAEAYQANLALLKLTPEQWENYLALPEETRAKIAASYVVADDSTKTRIAAALSDAGSTAGTGAAVSFDKSFKPKGETTVTADANTKPAERDLARVTDKKRTAQINAKANTASAAMTLNALTRSRSAAVTARAYTNQANRDLNWLARTRFATVVVSTVDKFGKPVR